MDLIFTSLAKIVSSVGPFFILLGLLIFVHELGHYLVAVFFGVRVETFSLGFGKKILSYKRKDTTYCLSIIPLGGYVKMYGDDPTAEIPEDQKKYSFLHKPVWPRIAIVLAGPLMNFFFAIFIFAIIGMIGESVPGTQIGDVNPDSPAYTAGFRSGDLIQKVGETEVVQWNDVKEFIENGASQTLRFQVSREGTNTIDSINVSPSLGKNEFIFSTQREVGRIEGLNLYSVSTMVGLSGPNTIAAKSGLKTFDVIEAINGNEILFWRQLEPQLQKIVSTESEIVLKVSTYSDKDEDKKLETREIRIATAELSKSEPILNQLGIMRSDLFLKQIIPKSPAEIAGLKSGDYLIKIDEKPVSTWQTVLDRVKSFKEDEKSISFTVMRDGQPLTLAIKPNLEELPTDQGGMEKRYAIGVKPAIFSVANNSFILKTSNPFKALVYGVEQSLSWTKLIAVSFVRLIQNEVSPRNIGGVITIGRVASKSFEVGIGAFLKMMAIISINLFLLNLLPVPVLDGGHLVFFTIEALKGAPISFKKLEIAQQVGLVLLLSLMLFALFNDITHLISSW